MNFWISLNLSIICSLDVPHLTATIFLPIRSIGESESVKKFPKIPPDSLADKSVISYLTITTPAAISQQ